ncbi:MAG: molybdopterin dinucleotide-binding protein [Deltaproteobacteria bacterium]|nr:molybdopterin dinucleotide-binding protein [Deltaproteobacteria bacterium]
MTSTQCSFCRFCHSGCGILVDVEDGRPVRVRGDRENPAYRGFCCIKGQQLPDQWGHPDRLLHTQKRMSDGSHRPVPFAEAIEDIAERLSDILVSSGPRSIAMFSGTYSIANPATMPVALAFMHAIGSSMHFTSNSIDQPGKAVAQALHGSWLAPPPPFDEREVALLIGTNPTVTMSGGVPLANPGREFTDALGRGMRFIVIDPRRTETARRAHIHLQCRPGEDVSLVAAMLNVILREELHDVGFVEEEVSGLADLRAAVAPFEPEDVAKRADVSAADLVEAARLFAGGRGVATAGTGPNFNGLGTLFEYLVLALNTVCGQWSRAGEPVPHPGTLAPPFPAIAQAAPPRAGYGYGQKLRVRDIANCDGGLQASALAEEILMEGEGQVRALLSVGGNPAVSIPDQLLNVRALEQLDLLVQIDIKLSATASLADYVIAPKVPLEMPGMTLTQDLITFYAAGMGYGAAYAQYSPPIVEPPEGSEVVEEWEFFYSLARRMGLELAIRPASLTGASSDVEAVTLDPERKPSSDEIFEILTRNARVPLAEVKMRPHGDFFPEPAVTVAEREPGWTGRLDVGNREMLADLQEVARSQGESEESDGYPYRLVCRRLVHTFNSNGQDLERLRRKWAYNPAFMHPEDLDRESLTSGDLVEIASKTGAILGIVQPDATLRTGIVSMPPSFGGLPGQQDKNVREWGTNPGRLLRVDDGVDRYTGQPRMSNVPVRVRAVEPAA